jgi:hypothetical protein
MYTNDLALDTTTFSLVTERPTSSLRADATAALDNPSLCNISHETAKNGKVSSVIYFDDDKISTDANGIVTSSLVRTQFKVAYNPNEGRTDIETVIARQIVLLQAFLNGAGNVDKFVNKEH